MTELEYKYNTLRNRGSDHHGAVTALAKQLGVDRATVVRTLQRAGVGVGVSYKAQRRRQRAEAAQ